MTGIFLPKWLDINGQISLRKNMNTETLIDSLTFEDLRATLRFMNEDSSGTIDDLKDKVRSRSMKVSWRYMLPGVPKESLRRICDANGLRSDVSKDEMIDQILVSLPKRAPQKGALRDLGSLWLRWTSLGQRRRD
jgi:hypothetical protein